MRTPLTAMLLVLPALSAGAQTINLAGATQTLQIDAAHPPETRNGEPAWWPTPLDPKPFTAAKVYFTPGLDPSGAYSTQSGGTNQISWSSWRGETEAYPNKNGIGYLRANDLPVPNHRDSVSIDLIARTMPPAVEATLPAPIAGRTILSGAFNSYPYSQQYGYFEMVARVPKGDGLWPAFWLLPVDFKSGEIDIMEILGRDTTVTYSSIHTSDPAWNAAFKPTFSYQTVDLSLAYHRYGVDWEANTITFYLDGSAIETVPTPADMHKPYYITANLAVGGPGSWAGPIDDTTMLPAIFRIQAINVWQIPQ